MKHSIKNWESVRQEFTVDGSLRDIYIQDIDIPVWNNFILMISTSKYRFEFWHGSLKRNLPSKFCKIKELQQVDPTSLHLFIENNIQLNCHFFFEHEIELDISAYDIQSLQDYEILINFLIWISDTLGKNVILTQENTSNEVILEVEFKEKY